MFFDKKFWYVFSMYCVVDFDRYSQTYPVEWKRKAFFKFVDIFHNASWTQDLKAKVWN